MTLQNENFAETNAVRWRVLESGSRCMKRARV